MAIELEGLNTLADGIGQEANLTLQAWSIADPTKTLLDSQTVTYDAAVNGVIDITSNVTFTLTAGETVGEVRLYRLSALLASETLITDNDFPNGGDLIVTSFQITVV